MAHPPRIPVRLPWGTSVVYFLTLCEKDRRNAWSNDEFFGAFFRASEKLSDHNLWFISAAVIMPDHLHVLATPLRSRDQPIGNLSAALKRWIKAEMPTATWNFQSGSFDRLLRENECAQQKWLYMRENPVRAGLVEHWEDWPYSIGIREPVELP